MTNPPTLPEAALARLDRPVALTRLGMAAERLTYAFWPFWTAVFAVLAVLAFGVHDYLPLEALWAGVVLALGLILWTLFRGVRRFSWPSRAETLDRLDRTLPGRPITALYDVQAIGAGDAASEAVWRAHVDRMAERAAQARAPQPDLRVSSRDPFALRYVALTAFILALLFGSLWRVASVGDAVAGTSGGVLAGGPAWEGWVEPPAYTGRPSLYLNDIAEGPLEVPTGSRVTLRIYGEVGALTVAETVSGRVGEVGSAADIVQEFQITQDGTIEVDGPGGREWKITALPDAAPAIEPADEVERTASGEMRRPFTATDDYGVVAGRAEIALDLETIERTHGLAIDPEPRETIVIDLPMTITGDRSNFTETLVEDFSEHPWANLPVTLTLIAEDAPGQIGRSAPEDIVLPGLRFFDPLAAAVVEQRRDLLWSRENLPRVIQVLRAVTHRPDGLFRDQGVYLQMRVLMRRLDTAQLNDGLTPEARDEVAEVLWSIALKLEFGDLADARERLSRAQDRLNEAMRNGASDAEIAELMQELREAMQDYMRQLAQQQGEGQENQQNAENMQEITGDQLQQMMDEIQRLMEEGRMAEAQQLLSQLMELMQNLQVTEGGPGQQSPGQQAMEGLAETLRDQQGLSDEAFRDLQEQFNQPGQQGQQGQEGEGQQGQQGQQEGQGEDGQGQQGQPGQPGQGQQGQSGQPRSGEGQGTQQGMGQGQGENRLGQGDGGTADAGTLSDRQRALRRELDRQRGNLPGAGTPEGDAARDALDRAGRAMDNAEEALRNDDLAEALDDQAEAMEALREGMRNLGEAMAQQQQQEGQQGQTMGQGDPMGRRDPLGRDVGNSGRVGTDENLLQGDDIYRRAEELLDEIRRRSGDQSRPDVERDYLERLLDRF